MKIRFTQVELPSLHLLWKRKNGEEIVSSVIRTNYPKPSLYYIPAIVQKTRLCKIKAIDMKIRYQEKIIPYRTFKYGDGVMIASKMGIPFEKLNKTLKNTDILGLSINCTSWSNIAIEFMKYAKKVNSAIIIIIGGNEAIFRPEHYLKKELADIAVTGEAENSLPALIKALKNGTNLDNVMGIAYKKDNKIIRTNPAPKPEMDNIPFPALKLLKKDIPLWTTPIEYFPLFELGINTPIGFTFFTRGCYQNCAYCTTPKKMGKFRFKSLKKISKELDHFKKHGITTLNIWDDSLTSVLHPCALGRKKGRKYLIQLAKMLKRKDFAYEFSQGVVIRDLWDNEKNQPDFELINILYSNKKKKGKFVGCYGEYFPTECLQIENPHKRYSKLMTFNKEKRVLKAILDAGTKFVTFSSIIGAKEDTAKGFRLATKRLQELYRIVKRKGGKSLATPFVHSVFPGARLWNDYKGNLEYSIKKYPELYQLNAAPHKTSKFKPHEITLAKKEIEKKLMTPNQFAKWNATRRYQWS